MRRRWIIRGFWIGFIALCFVGWCWSSTHDTGLRYSRLDPPRLFECSSANGVLVFYADTNPFWEPAPTLGGSSAGPDTNANSFRDVNGWKLYSDYSAENEFWPHSNGGDEKAVVDTFGFYVGKPILTNAAWVVGIPYWFLVLLATGIFWLVCRKTRPRRKGFPLEPEEVCSNH
jgi:hypothetical protein